MVGGGLVIPAACFPPCAWLFRCSFFVPWGHVCIWRASTGPFGVCCVLEACFERGDGGSAVCSRAEKAVAKWQRRGADAATCWPATCRRHCLCSLLPVSHLSFWLIEQAIDQTRVGLKVCTFEYSRYLVFMAAGLLSRLFQTREVITFYITTPLFTESKWRACFPRGFWFYLPPSLCTYCRPNISWINSTFPCRTPGSQGYVIILQPYMSNNFHVLCLEV